MWKVEKLNNIFILINLLKEITNYIYQEDVPELLRFQRYISYIGLHTFSVGIPLLSVNWQSYGFR